MKSIKNHKNYLKKNINVIHGSICLDHFQLLKQENEKLKEENERLKTDREHLQKSIDEMIKRGILSEKVGNIAKRELEKLKGASSKEQETPVLQEASPQKAKILRKDTLKAKAFRLFDEDKRPSDLEVKALKIKSGVLYGYYQEWKKLTAQ